MSASEERAVQLIKEAVEKKAEFLQISGSSTFTLGFLPEGHLQVAREFLKRVDLSYNQFLRLPEEIKKLPYLDTLNVSRNRIRSFTDFSEMPALRHLNVSHNQIKVLSFQDSNRQLLSLDISYNRVTVVNDIQHLESIYDLNMDFNGISSLPDRFASLKSLKKLCISANILRELPSSFSSLTSLTELNISHNKINHLPSCLEKLPNMTNFIIEGNPIKDDVQEEPIVDKWQSNQSNKEIETCKSPRATSPSVLGQQRSQTPKTERLMLNQTKSVLQPHTVASGRVHKRQDVDRSLNRSAPKKTQNRATFAAGSYQKALDSYESLLSLDVRSNLLLRAVRVRLDCRESLDKLRAGGSWILLPPNIVLGEHEIDAQLVREHVITFTNKNNHREFTSQSGNHGILDFDNKKIDITRTGSIVGSPRLRHHFTFEVIEHGRISMEQSDFMCVLINDVVTTKAASFSIAQNVRTYEQFLEQQPINKRKKFEARIDKFIKNVRRDLNSPDSLCHANPSAVVDEEVSRILRIVLNSGLFATPLPSKQEIHNLRQDIRKVITKPIYTQLFKHAGSLEADKVFMEKIHKLKWIQFNHLELPFSFDAMPTFDSAIKTLKQLHKEICPNQKVQLLLAACKTLFQLLAQGTDGDSDSGADQFLPAMIYLIIRANPPNFISNLQYIETFCSHKNELSGEASYYHTNALSCIKFIENIRAEDLDINPEEFARKMAQQDELPLIHTLHFVHHGLQDIHITEIGDLLAEYQKLATWYIAAIDKQEAVALQVPQSRVWGQLKVKTKDSELFCLLRIPSQNVPFSMEWLKYSSSTKLGKDPLNIFRIKWLPDILVADDSDCGAIWDVLFSGDDVLLEVDFQ